jgi:glyoxylase-like metal-dependent hydrolase (beta-lactamase superfamily II)
MMVKKSRTGRFAPALVAMAVGLGTLTTGHWGRDVLAQAKREAVKSLRMYIFDLGEIPVNEGRMFNPPIQVAKGGCCVIVGHLIVHPKGTLIWDTGVVPDALIGSGKPGTDRYTGKPFREKLAEVGYRPEDITYLAFSHYHFDHTANANMFKDSTWIVQEAERNAMFAGTKIPGGSPPDPTHYSELKNSKTIILANIEEFDVFGDRSVVIKRAPGHTAAQQVLILNLPKTGKVMLAGDLYHFREEREQQVLPAALEYSNDDSRASRIKIEEYIKKNNIPMWIEHDSRLYATLKKAPKYIE